MSTQIGQDLLGQLIDNLGIQGISAGLQSALAVRFGQMYETGSTFFGNNQLAAVLMSIPSSRSALADAGIDNIIGAGTAIGQAKENLIPLPCPGSDIDIDAGTIDETPVIFSAEDGAYNFTDDATIETNVIINNFSADDIITFSNAEIADYSFANEGTDVMLSYNYNDEGIMNVIQLTGVVSSESMVYDQASFVEAIGFDPFVV